MRFDAHHRRPAGPAAPLLALALSLALVAGASACSEDPCDNEDAWVGNAEITKPSHLEELDGVKCILGSLVVGEMKHDGSAGKGIQPGLELSENITHIDGLESVEIIEGDLHIAGNKLLVDIEGLRNLTHVGREIRIADNPRGDAIIHQNAILDDIGLESLFGIGANFIISSNDNLRELEGLASLERIGWEFKILDNEQLSTKLAQAFVTQDRIKAPGGRRVSGNGEGDDDDDDLDGGVTDQ